MSEIEFPTAPEDGATLLSRDLLADAMLAATLGRKSRKLINTPAVAAIVVVPTASCAAAVKDALHRENRFHGVRLFDPCASLVNSDIAPSKQVRSEGRNILGCFIHTFLHISTTPTTSHLDSESR